MENILNKIKGYKSDKLTVLSVNDNKADVIYLGKEIHDCNIEIFGPEKQYIFIETNKYEEGDGVIINTDLLK